MMPCNIGIVAGAARSVPVIVGGGTQMAAVMAGVARLHPEVVGNFIQGTTRWLMNDPNSSMKRIMDCISDRIPIVYVNVDYSDSPYEGLQAYEWGFIKEGVGCGGASVGAVVESAGKVTCKDLVDKVHEIYRGIMGYERSAPVPGLSGEVLVLEAVVVRRDDLPVLRDADVLGAYYLPGRDQLLDPVGAPSDRTRYGEHGGEELPGYPQHVVEEPAVKVDVGADAGGAVPAGADDLRRQLLYGLEQPHVLLPALLLRQLPGIGFEYHRPGVGEGVDRMAHPVDEPLPVEGLLVHYLGEVFRHGLPVIGVGDVGLYVVHHLHDLDVGAAVLRAFQGEQGRRDDGIRVRSGGGDHPGRER